jgi:predicted flap endonuclease-1-like 5' DNA nuclease
MLYLTVQMLALLLLALVIGAAIGWLLKCARDAAAQEARSAADAVRMADLRRDRDAAETALAEAKVADPAVDDGKLAELQSALDECRANAASLAAERDTAKAALTAAEAKPTVAVASSPAAAVATTALAVSVLSSAPSDDLKQIFGIGPKLEGLLNEAGILRFEQIANLTPDQITDLDDILNFKRRIERDDWVGQAKRFASGETL